MSFFHTMLIFYRTLLKPVELMGSILSLENHMNMKSVVIDYVMKTVDVSFCSALMATSLL